jgi:P27 family predicted phage terminase small subunit
MATTGRPTGRPPRPTEVKRLLGNPGHRPIPDAPLPGEGLVAADSVPTPPDLGDAGLDLWERVWTAGRSWLSLDVDYPLIVMLCQAQDEAEEIRRLLVSGEEERFYVVGNGQKVTSPLVSQLKDLRVQITAWLSSLGYSPTDRSRLGVGEVRQTDALDELQRRRTERRTKAVND